MSLSILAPYLLKQLMLVPLAAYCIAPLWRYVRRRPAAALWGAGALAAALALLPGLLCALMDAGRGVIALELGACLAALLLLVGAPWGKAAFCFANAAMLGCFCEAYTTCLTAPVELSNGGEGLSAASALVCLAVAVAVGAVFWRTLRVKLPRLMAEERIGGIWTYLWLLPGGMALFLRWAQPVSPAVMMTGRVRVISLVLFPFCLGFMLVLYDLLWRTTVRVSDSARLEQENRLLQAESQRYRELNAYMAQTRALRHDFRQHLHVLSRLAATGQHDRLKAYLEQLEGSVGEEHERYCANPAVDALVAHYARRGADAGIRTRFDIDLPQALPVSEIDCCVLIGNLLENAFNAVEAVEEPRREVRLVSGMLSQAMLGLSVENPYLGPLVMDAAGRPVAGREGHGTGLASASAVVGKYRGSMDIKADGGVFSVSVLLYL